MNLNMQSEKALDKKTLTIVWILSVIIPLAVAILIFMPTKISLEGGWVYALPHINGTLNTITSVLLILGLIFIKKGRIEIHKRLMLTGFILGGLFLVSYVIYHASAPSTLYGDLDGNGVLSEAEAMAVSSSRSVYLIILLSHILLAIIVVPLVLLALIYALKKSFVKHKRIVKYAYPIWLYVSITGVVVYFMISPYY